MEFGVWFAMITLFLAGGLTPGPAVMLTIASSLRYGFWMSMFAALGVCAANIVWIGLAASGAGLIAEQFPTAFLALKLGGVLFICWLAWKLVRQPPDTHFEEEVAEVFGTDAKRPPRYGRIAALFFRGFGLQLANPNALVFFGGLLPTFFDTSRDVIPQALTMIVTVSATELFGLTIYASVAAFFAHQFSNPLFSKVFSICAAILMVGSVLWAVLTQMFAG